MTKYCLLLLVVLTPSTLLAQCANTAYGGGFTCVQSPNAVQNGATTPLNVVSVSFAAATTPGNGVLIFGHLCTANPCANTGTPVNISVTDNVNDAGFQPCTNNGSNAYVRYFYCWWLPVVGSATTFTLHANASYGAGIWVAEFSGGCNTSACIGTDVPVVYCMGPCGAQIVTNFTNVLVTGFAMVGGTLLTPQTANWKNISTIGAGSGIGNFQPTPGPYVPTWTNATMFNALAVSIKSRTNSIYTQITVPSMPLL